jgi:hypothetical protein
LPGVKITVDSIVKYDDKRVDQKQKARTEKRQQEINDVNNL